ncbi:MAG TPA: phosphodiester glycosidase family protein [Clostridia bacterium]|nr:phosphodiester glycosidase family protein [Clostridia bacterium]
MAKDVFKKSLICLGILLFWVLFFLFGSAAVIFRGPSPAARDLAVSTLMETSAAKFVARIFLSDEEIRTILAKNAVSSSDAVTNSDLVHIPEDSDSFNLNAITVEDVSGPTFKGKMMIVNDPARLYVASPSAFGLESGGLRVEEMVKRDGAAAGINAGGFEDDNGVGNGGKPLGIVIQNGVLTFGTPTAYTIVIGFDRENKLVVGSMTGVQALARGVRDAVSFVTPALIVNGKPADIFGTGGGLNPRTAIGQRADGAVLLLVIDGRQAHSIGANYKDIIDVMLRYGAVNAANLDGGSSTLMVYNNEILNVCASLYGSRKLPTAILVRQVMS